MSDEAQMDLDLPEETVVEVEATEAPEVEVVEEQKADDNFDKAHTSTQKRIDRLTKKMREAERREQEAINYAKQVQNEAQTLKQRMDALDTSYVSEVQNRVSSQIQQAEVALKQAMDVGDSAKTVEAQKALTALTLQQERAQQAAVQAERQRQQAQYAQQTQQAQYAQQAQQRPQAAPKRPDPKAEQWAVKNSWFGQDEAMTYAAFGIHKKLVEDEGFDPQTDDYYNELDKRIAGEFPHKLSGNSKRPAQTVAGASRTSTGRSNGKKVRLTPSQVAIAKKLGVPLEEYAKYVKEQ
jgi:murein DD-endopeptidase MepM/ murein hydrolase activator NlpD